MKKLFWIAAVGAVAYGVNHPSLLTSYAKNKVSDTITQTANQVFEKAWKIDNYWGKEIEIGF